MTNEQTQYIRDKFGLRIVTLRKMKEMSQAQLAAAAGIDRTHLNRIESGKYNVTIETAYAIAQALGMTLDIIDPRLSDLAPLKTI